MAHADTNPVGSFWGTFLASPEARAERRKQRALVRKKQRDEDIKVAKDLRETGYSDQHQDAYFYRHYYF